MTYSDHVQASVDAVFHALESLPVAPAAVEVCDRCLLPLDALAASGGVLVSRLGVWCRTCEEG